MISKPNIKSFQSPCLHLCEQILYSREFVAHILHVLKLVIQFSGTLGLTWLEIHRFLYTDIVQQSFPPSADKFLKDDYLGSILDWHGISKSFSPEHVTLCSKSFNNSPHCCADKMSVSSTQKILGDLRRKIDMSLGTLWLMVRETWILI